MNVNTNPRHLPMGWFCLALALCGLCFAVAEAEAAGRPEPVAHSAPD